VGSGLFVVGTVNDSVAEDVWGCGSKSAVRGACCEVLDDSSELLVVPRIA